MRTDPNGNITLYGTLYNCSSIDLYNPPSHLSWDSRIAINYTGETSLCRETSNAYFNPDTGEIWVLYKYQWIEGNSDDRMDCYTGDQNPLDSPTWFARINPNTSSIIENKKLGEDFSGIISYRSPYNAKTRIFFSSNDTQIIKEGSGGIEITQAYNSFTSKDDAILIFSRRDDELFGDFIIDSDKIIITSRFNRDLWVSIVSLIGNHEILSSRVRLTSDYTYNYIEESYSYKNNYYIKSWSYNAEGDQIYTTHSSSNGLQWSII